MQFWRSTAPEPRLDKETYASINSPRQPLRKGVSEKEALHYWNFLCSAQPAVNDRKGTVNLKQK
jgi:hypothetical protein